jgi:hypothetical protein
MISKTKKKLVKRNPFEYEGTIIYRVKSTKIKNKARKIDELLLKMYSNDIINILIQYYHNVNDSSIIEFYTELQISEKDREAYEKIITGLIELNVSGF